MIPLSVLDLVPVTEGATPREALRKSLDLARHAERLGYRRYWVAEHHNMTGIASAATAVVIGYLAGGTSTIRVGAGGIMLPNHAPLVIAEQFGTLESLYPGRIDLGLGRAPGTDQPGDAGAAARSRPGRRVSAGRPGAAGVSGARPARTDDSGGAGGRAQRAALDSRFEHVRRAACGAPGTAVCVRLALRARRADRSARRLPRAVSTVRAARPSLRHDRRQRGRRRQRRGGAVSVHDTPAGVCQPRSRPAGPATAADRGHRRSTGRRRRNFGRHTC